MSSRLYVGNIPFSATEEQLKELFGAEGREVEEVAIITDRDTGRPRGFAFVTMANDEDAKAAISACDGHSMDGRSIRVDEAQERSRGGRGGPRGGGGFGDGGGFGGREGRGGRGGPRGGGGGGDW